MSKRCASDLDDTDEDNQENNPAKRRKCTSFASNILTTSIRPRALSAEMQRLAKFSQPELFAVVVVCIEPISTGANAIESVDSYLSGECPNKDVHIQSVATNTTKAHPELKEHGFVIDASTNEKTFDVQSDVDASPLSQLTQFDECGDTCPCGRVRLSGYPHLFSTMEDAKEAISLFTIPSRTKTKPTMDPKEKTASPEKPASAAASASEKQKKEEEEDEDGGYNDRESRQQIFRFRLFKSNFDHRTTSVPVAEPLPLRKFDSSEAAKEGGKTKKMSDAEAVAHARAYAKEKQNKQKKKQEDDAVAN